MFWAVTPVRSELVIDHIAAFRGAVGSGAAEPGQHQVDVDQWAPPPLAARIGAKARATRSGPNTLTSKVSATCLKSPGEQRFREQDVGVVDDDLGVGGDRANDSTDSGWGHLDLMRDHSGTVIAIRRARRLSRPFARLGE